MNKFPKRAFDIVLSLPMAAVLLPVLVVIAIAIRFSGPQSFSILISTTPSETLVWNKIRKSQV